MNMQKMVYIEESKLLQVLEVLTVWSDASTTQQGKDAIKTVMAVLDSTPNLSVGKNNGLIIGSVDTLVFSTNG
jgi:hypothetical protein